MTMRRKGEGMSSMADPKVYAEARRKGQAGHKAANAGALYCIGGEYVRMPDIAERLDVHLTTAQERYRKAKRMPGPITWESLRGKA